MNDVSVKPSPNCAGHGTWLEVCESPWIGAARGAGMLQDGMVFPMEPGGPATRRPGGLAHYHSHGPTANSRFARVDSLGGAIQFGLKRNDNQ